jgi:hypothetical protein
VRPEALLFANAAVIDDSGLLDIKGSAWRYFEPERFPATLAGSVCGILIVEDADYGAIHTIEVEVGDEHGHVVPTAGAVTSDCTEPSQEMTIGRIAFVCPFMAVIREPTVVTARVTCDGAPLGDLDLIVRAKRDDA